MDKFVCVRIIQTNGMDLSLFQFDYDATFTAFFMNADKTIYGRYGTRRSGHKEADGDMSLKGFAKAMESALKLHADYPSNRTALAGKKGPAPRFARPELYPSLKGRYGPKLNFKGDQVVRSCIHCHQIRDAERNLARASGKPMPDKVLYPWPVPDVVGLSIHTDDPTRVKTVEAGSIAGKGGFKAGDRIVTMAGQPILSIADVQWVLETAREPSRIKATVQRGAKMIDVQLDLSIGWRRASDISFRTTTWNLRRMGFGGMFPVDLTDAERRARGMSRLSLGLRLQHVGQYGQHAIAKRAGFVKGDVIIEFDGIRTRKTETELLAYILQKKIGGDRVKVTIVRGDRKLEKVLPIPKH